MSDTSADTDAEAGTGQDLDELCRGAERLVRLAGPGLSRLQVTSGGTAVVVEWNGPPTAGRPPAAAGGGGADEGEPHEEEDTRTRVLSPCVGTFYHRPQPDAPPFVTPGDAVTPGQQIGVVEAMKLMTPVAAPTAGLVAELLVPDGEPVEFGQPLIAIEPA
ncbi:acetyl-CoA carboxylase biotin carboxyl carrier protein [Streptomyces kanamyceticus]|uniref:Biotin carboxyl carrier protein of acetyl-CoA carboxylase n=1 Tax=Streptomyces kanamyceticus TaxID=1967 RepID=A0A5J6G525_STRKN|nr:biotin/lipoyl-containing protein [Streptomyces kanamyceticus]QEU90750.1 biotin/lipoyl-binding protein [Streptomyces kanamyceticus]